MTLRAAALTLAVAACGDDDPPVCYVEAFSGTFGELDNRLVEGCGAATRFVARDTATIIPTQDELDRYYERWRRVIAAEPILKDRAPQRHRSGFDFVADIRTSNPVVIAALADSPAKSPIPPTGDAEFDQLISELVRPELFQKGIVQDGSMASFGVASCAEFNEELFHARLLPTSSHLPDVYIAPMDDGTWTWPELGPGVGADDATAQIDFSFGWGDCFVSCYGMRDLRAIVPPEGPATVYDLGGDPLPPELTLSPNTLPPP